MQTITLETQIAAPLERCFLLSLSIDLHQKTASQTDEKAIAGITHGLIGLGETVTWRGRHFGLWLTHKVRISGYSRPVWFQDVMEEGLFRTFIHDHHFSSHKGGTLMRDVLQFSAPYGVLGRTAELLLLRRHMKKFLTQRNSIIKDVAESADESWQAFLN